MEPTIIGAVLAGGRGLRFGGQDKGLLSLLGRPLHEWVINRLRPQVSSLCVVAPEPPTWLDNYDDLRFISDQAVSDEPIGPAGALLSVLKSNKANQDSLVMTATIDAPFLPTGFVSKLFSEIRVGDDAVLPVVNGRLQPAFGLWRTSASTEVQQCVHEKDYALHIIARRVGARVVHFQDDQNSFFNINTQEDLIDAERIASGWD